MVQAKLNTQVLVPLVAVSLALGVLSCNRRGDSEPVRVGDGKRGEKIGGLGVACMERLSRSRVSVNEKTVEDPKSIGLEICQATEENYSSSVDSIGSNSADVLDGPELDPEPVTPPKESKPSLAADEKVSYKRIKRPISYVIDAGKNELALTLSIGLDFPAETPETSKKAVVGVIEKQCIEKLKKSWSALKVKMSLKVLVDSMDFNGRYDQMFALGAANGLETKDGASFFLKSWPDRGQIVPEPKLPAGCRLDCRREFFEKANARFCTNFALVAGQLLGLKSKASENETCKSVDPIIDEATTPLKGGFMYAEGLADKPEKFWKRAKFTREDIKTMLSPACLVKNPK